MQTDRTADLEVLIGHNFRDKSLLLNALSHSSIKSEQRPSNERMEFLGDSVLGLIISDALYRRYPEDDEGSLTRVKSQAVSRATLQRVALAMGLDRYILVGKGVAKREIPASLLGNLYEAIVGALYLDAGLSAARKFIMRQLDVIIEAIVDDRAERNYKSLLQHHCQKDLGAVPVYRVLREAGPAHNRHFEVSVHAGGTEYGVARAQSKKEAEQGAARAALIHFRAVDETERTLVRGAGDLIRVGPEGASKRSGRGRRSKRRDRPAAPVNEEAAPVAAPAPTRERSKPKPQAQPQAQTQEPAPAHAPAREGESSRRSRGGRRRRGGRGRRRSEANGAPSNGAPEAPAPQQRRESAPPPPPPAPPPRAEPKPKPESSPEPAREAKAPRKKTVAKKAAAKKKVATKKTVAKKRVAKKTPKKKAATTRKTSSKKKSTASNEPASGGSEAK